MAPVTLRRQLNLDALVLKSGGHQPDGEFCVMEAVSYIAGEDWSDRPSCACPIIATFLRRWNDDLNDTDRQMLKPYIPRLVGTRASAEVEQKRGWLISDWLVRVHTPAWLELAGLNDQAETLRGLPPLLSFERIREAKPSIDGARSKAAAARAAAWAAARDAAWDDARAAAWDAARAAAWAAAWDAARAAAWAAARAAAWDAAGAAAWDAARAAAWDAAGAAARAAARDAARDAAWAAARDAARDAANKKLAPTKVALQQSALELVDALIACD